MKITENVGTNFVIGYQRTYRILTVASRDLYQNVFWNGYQDGSVMSILWDTGDDDYPLEKNCVRMQCPIGGFHVFPQEGDPTKSYIRMVVEADLKGNIPQYITQQALNVTSLGLVMLRKVYPKYLKEWKTELE